jgi:hypothetical protein
VIRPYQGQGAEPLPGGLEQRVRRLAGQVQENWLPATSRPYGAS